jgi:hypothetical protein
MMRPPADEPLALVTHMTADQAVTHTPGPPGPAAANGGELSLSRTLRIGSVVFIAFIVFSGPIVAWRFPYLVYSWGWTDYAAKLRDPWLDLSKHAVTPDQYSHLPKLNYRLTAPILAKLLHIEARGYMFLSMLACFVTGCTFVRFGWRVTRDGASALHTGLLFAGLTAASQSVRSFTGHFDGLAFCFIGLAVVATRPSLVAAAIFLASWTDQRAVLVAAIIALTHSLRPEGTRDGKWFDLARPSCVAVAGGVLAWAITFALARVCSGMAFRSDGLGLGTMMGAAQFAPQAVWGAFEGSWILVVGAVAVAWRCGQRTLSIAAGGCIGLYLLAVFATMDLSRSAGYLIPSIPLAMALLAIGSPAGNVRRQIRLAAFISLLAPNIEIIVNVRAHLVEPLWQEFLLRLPDWWILLTRGAPPS